MMSEMAASLVSLACDAVLGCSLDQGLSFFPRSAWLTNAKRPRAEYTAKLNGVSYVAEPIGNGSTTSSSGGGGGGSAKSPSGSSTSGSGSVTSADLNGGAMSAATLSTTGMALAAAAAGGLLVLLA